jgi:hypothetical protein
MHPARNRASQEKRGYPNSNNDMYMRCMQASRAIMGLCRWRRTQRPDKNRCFQTSPTRKPAGLDRSGGGGSRDDEANVDDSGTLGDGVGLGLDRQQGDCVSGRRSARHGPCRAVAVQERLACWHDDSSREEGFAGTTRQGQKNLQGDL